MLYHSSTVFLISDDSAVRDALSISLSMDGLKIAVYPSGEAFLETYRGQPGCLLLDLTVFEMDSLTVQQVLINRSLTIPIIFLTGIGTQHDEQLAVISGAYCLLEKPVSRSLLLKSIHEAMEQDHLNRSIGDDNTLLENYSSAS